ncbi:hypothetical protein [Flavobacterium sp. DSP2-3-1]|uniref:hypothetical protein n=1 Tax=Flavobacterium sp. DSP2-3-1 TaxID=2804620 RepID=UPI003CF1D740
METLKNSKNAINYNEIIAVLNRTSLLLENLKDFKPSLNYIGVAKYVLLREASHGALEYYTWSAKITQRLV